MVDVQRAPGLTVSIEQQSPVRLSVDLSCAPGELLAVVGPSGSGKSTLLRVIAGLNRSATGNIVCHGMTWLNSREEINLSARKRRIGFVFQQYALFPHLTAIENVMEALTQLPLDQRLPVARQWLERVNMPGLEQRHPASLSGGQQQRVALARALAGDPRALLLDEPFAAVDRVTREKLYRELALLRRELDIPALLVTHDVEEAMMLADRLCIFAQGSVLQADEVQRIIQRPYSGQVARLVGHRNIFRAQVLSHQADTQRTMIEWRGLRLAAVMQNQFAVGSQISWVIPRSKLLVFTPKTDNVQRENAIMGSVSELVLLGDMAALTVSVEQADLPPVHISLPVHVLNRRSINVGDSLWITLEADGIWLMPNDKYRSGEANVD